MTENEFVYIWRIYHPNNLNPERFIGEKHTELITEEEYEYLMEDTDRGSRFSGHLITTSHHQTPTLTKHWSDKGWRIESKCRAKRVEVSEMLSSID